MDDPEIRARPVIPDGTDVMERTVQRESPEDPDHRECPDFLEALEIQGQKENRPSDTPEPRERR
jgi:hypothetical protein